MLIIRFFKLSSCWLWPFTNSLGFMTLKVKNEEANYSRNHMSFFIRYIRGEGERNISHPGKLEIPMIFVESSRKMRQLIDPIISFLRIHGKNIRQCTNKFRRNFSPPSPPEKSRNKNWIIECWGWVLIIFKKWISIM